jgi:transposase
MLADALGRPVRFILTGGQVHDIVAAPALLEGIEGGAVIADKAYDSNSFRQIIADADMLAVIPFHPVAQGPHPARQNPLQDPQPHRTLLQQAQALPTLLNALRPPRHTLPRIHPSRCSHAMDAVNVDSA